VGIFLEYFCILGYPCAAHANPANFFLDCLCFTWIFVEHEYLIKTEFSNPMVNNVYFLSWRFLLNEYQDQSNIFGGIFQALILGFSVKAIFYQLPNNTQQGIVSKAGLIYIAASF
jgi:hypothetical protein